MRAEAPRCAQSTSLSLGYTFLTHSPQSQSSRASEGQSISTPRTYPKDKYTHAHTLSHIRTAHTRTRSYAPDWFHYLWRSYPCFSLLPFHHHRQQQRSISTSRIPLSRLTDFHNGIKYPPPPIRFGLLSSTPLGHLYPRKHTGSAKHSSIRPLEA